jgi:hypothetical protein
MSDIPGKRRAEPLADTAFAQISEGLAGLQQLLRTVTEHDRWIPHDELPIPKRLALSEIRARRLPARKVGKTWLIRASDFDTYVLTHGTEAPSKAKAKVLSNDADSIAQDVLRRKGLKLVKQSA